MRVLGWHWYRSRYPHCCQVRLTKPDKSERIASPKPKQHTAMIQVRTTANRALRTQTASCRQNKPQTVPRRPLGAYHVHPIPGEATVCDPMHPETTHRHPTLPASVWNLWRLCASVSILDYDRRIVQLDRGISNMSSTGHRSPPLEEGHYHNFCESRDGDTQAS